jgi:glycosyltransferase involved in cell wall biosynthesis
MRIVIASTYVPFIKGGGTMIVESLERELKTRGHEVDSVWIPFRSFWPEIAQQTLALRSLDLSYASGRKIDLLITIRYPSYAIQHENKVCWFIHHHRGAYDLWGTPFQDIPNSPEGIQAREAMIRSDNLYLRELRKIYPISSSLGERLRKFNQIEPDGVLLTPHPNPELYYNGSPTDYFIYSARLTPGKRQDLLIEAMKYVRSPFKLVLVGQADTEEYEKRIDELIQRHHVAHKVIRKGWTSETEKAELTNHAFGALYVAYQEDGCGYSTLEALHAHRAVITCTDSGGTHDVVIHEENGLIVEPTTQALAEAMEQLWANKQRTIEMGERAYQTIDEKQINWDRVIEGLVG